jgi:hypothetical protein
VHEQVLPYSNCAEISIDIQEWELSIVVPRSDNATAIARMVMADKHPWCLLIPTDLIHYISQNVGDEFDDALRKK